MNVHVYIKCTCLWIQCVHFNDLIKFTSSIFISYCTGNLKWFNVRIFSLVEHQQNILLLVGAGWYDHQLTLVICQIIISKINHLYISDNYIIICTYYTLFLYSVIVLTFVPAGGSVFSCININYFPSGDKFYTRS
jgi:hypothetical protein